MKKMILFTLLVSCFTFASARTIDVSASYTGASHHFDQVKADATMALTLNSLLGLDAKMINKNGIKDPIYSVGTPLLLNFDFLKFRLRPFYYFKNKSEDPLFTDASAFGANAQVIMVLNEDVPDELYTSAFIGASFARQKGTRLDDNGLHNGYYSQLAYSAGVYQNFYQSFGFEALASAFVYPDGISGVRTFRGIMDQQDMADMLTFDIVHNLPKYTLGTRLTRIWMDTGATIYASYRYGEFHTADPEHSIIVGNTFILGQRLSVDVAYNHVRNVHGKDRRDIVFVRAGFSL